MDVSLSDIAHFLDNYLGSTRFPYDQNGVYHPSDRQVQRIGLALEPWAEIGTWVQQEHLDALFLHRPWRLNLHMFPGDVGILAYHLAFDLRLTFGFNLRLATVLRMTNLVPFALKDALPLGMLGTIAPTPLDALSERLAQTFGVPPVIEKQFTDTLHRIAIVGAMTDHLIRDAAEQDVQLYVTGQFRSAAYLAVHETKMTVAVIGHRAGELWGLRTLADLLSERWTQLEVIVASTPLTV